jgi:hypothetical protein
MAIKDIIAKGVGFSPGSVGFIPTHGYTAYIAVAPAGLVVVSPRRPAGRARYELWLTDDSGRRIRSLEDFLSLSATRVVNAIGQFTLRLPVSFDESLLREDRMVQVWRQPATGRLSLWRVYFIRDWEFAFSAQGESLEVFGPDCNDLLSRRIVAAYSGSAEASKSATAADDLMKEVVSESQLDTADPTPTAGTRTWTDFSVAGDLADGPTVDLSFAWDYLLTESGNGVLSQIANAARGQGTEVFFDVVPVISSTGIAFRFETYTGQPGQDVSDRVVFSPQNGNMKEARLRIITAQEENYIYAGGQGEAADRNVQQAYSATRYGISKWNRREGFMSDTRQGGDDATLNAAYSRLSEARPKIRFSGVPMDTRGTRFGRDWDHGYKVMAKYRNYQAEHIIRATTLYKPANGPEEIRVRLDDES